MKRLVSILLTAIMIMSVGVTGLAIDASAAETAIVNGKACEVGTNVTYTVDLCIDTVFEDRQYQRCRFRRNKASIFRSGSFFVPPPLFFNFIIPRNKPVAVCLCFIIIFFDFLLKYKNAHTIIQMRNISGENVKNGKRNKHTACTHSN